MTLDSGSAELAEGEREEDRGGSSSAASAPVKGDGPNKDRGNGWPFGRPPGRPVKPGPRGCCDGTGSLDLSHLGYFFY